jgi:hypothetical protein
LVIIPKTEKETENLCHWLDIIQVQPVTHSCFKRFELAENKEFAFWYMEEKQIIMTNREFPFPETETFISVQRFKDILKKKNDKYYSLIFAL